MTRKSKKHPDPEPSPEERRLDEQIAREIAIKKRSREIQFAWAKLQVAAERCRWTIRNFDRTPPFKFMGRWWRTFPWGTYTPRWICGWHVLARRLAAFASTLGASPEDLVPTGDHLALELERPRVAFIRDEFLLVLRGPQSRDTRRNRAARMAAKIAGDHEGGYWEYYHTLFMLIGSEGERRCNAALREIQATLRGEQTAGKEPASQSSTPTATSIERQASAGMGPHGIRHAADFSSLDAQGATFHFTTPLKRAVIAVLFTEWKRAGSADGTGLTVSALSEALHDAGQGTRLRLRMDKLFRGHSALGTILRKKGRDVWALHLKGPEMTPS